ncbi:MAG: flagellar biosynthetic protein FliO [Kofleriaceae bacterium]
MKLVLCLLTIPSIALAAPRFETVDRGDAIEVIARNVTAATTAVIPKRSRLEIELAGSPIIAPLVPTDKGVKVVELEGRMPRMLSVKVPLEREGVKRLARHARVFQIGSDVHILFPRDRRRDGATVRLPEPTLSAVAAIAPVTPIGPEKPATPKSEPKLEAKPEAKIDPKTEASASPVTPADAPAKAEPAAGAPKQAFLKAPEPSSNVTTYALLGLSAICVGAWFLKRKRAALAPVSSIEVIAQRSLGAKAKIVWLTAGGREMVVAVTPQSVRMLGQWKKAPEQELQAPLPEAHALIEPRYPRASTNAPYGRAQTQSHATQNAIGPQSASVAGIMRLRAKTVAPPIEQLDEDIATGDLDADALWAKEILAATGARR